MRQLADAYNTLLTANVTKSSQFAEFKNLIYQRMNMYFNATDETVKAQHPVLQKRRDRSPTLVQGFPDHILLPISRDGR